MKAMLEVIKYNGDNNILVYRYPVEDFSTKSQLIVQQSQEAVFYSRGQLADIFTEGTYTLSTKNIPILSNLINLPFGKESPFSAVIYFVNKTEQINIRWGIRKVSFIEPEFGALLNVGASGTLSFKVNDSKVFLSKLVGTKTSFSQSEVTVFLEEFINSHGKAHLANIFNTDKSISILTVEAKINDLAAKLYECLVDDFKDYGLKLEKFMVTSVAKDEESSAYQQLLQRRQQKLALESIKLDIERKKATQSGELDLLKQEQSVQQDIAARGIIIDSQAQAIKRKQEGYTYQQERGFVVAEKTAENEGVGTIASTGIGIGVGVGTANMAAAAVSGMYNDALSATAPKTAQESKEGTASSDVFSNIGLDNINSTEPSAPTNPNAQNAQPKSKKDRLLELKELFDIELITAEEYEARKSEILREI